MEYLTRAVAASPGEAAMLIPIIALIAGATIAVTAILTKHQRAMAELMRRDQQRVEPAMVDELRDLRREVRELRDRVNQSAIMSDGIEPLHRQFLEEQN